MFYLECNTITEKNEIYLFLSRMHLQNKTANLNWHNSHWEKLCKALQKKTQNFHPTKNTFSTLFSIWSVPVSVFFSLCVAGKINTRKHMRESVSNCVWERKRVCIPNGREMENVCVCVWHSEVCVCVWGLCRSPDSCMEKLLLRQPRWKLNENLMASLPISIPSLKFSLSLSFLTYFFLPFPLSLLSFFLS
jgi:hypothetical protein